MLYILLDTQEIFDKNTLNRENFLTSLKTGLFEKLKQEKENNQLPYHICLVLSQNGC